MLKGGEREGGGGAEPLSRTIKQNQFIQFKWDHDDSKEKFSFEFRIQFDELTGAGLLVVTDFADPEEEDEMKLLWESQIKTLLRTIGS